LIGPHKAAIRGMEPGGEFVTCTVSRIVVSSCVAVDIPLPVIVFDMWERGKGYKVRGDGRRQ
jgi:hypothetical protein